MPATGLIEKRDAMMPEASCVAAAKDSLARTKTGN
jgi:hypothetical protein